MPRPTTKDELLTLSTHNFELLFKLIDSVPAEKQMAEFPFEDRDRNIRDVLCHLYEWHLMMLGWYKTGMSGSKPVTPAEGYTWQTIPALNLVIWQKYQNTSLPDAIKLLNSSHQQVMKLIKKHSNDELFTKKYYPWTGTTSLGAYLISSTSSHYDWAIKKIKKYVKTLKD
ncbi:ClbS/DfsB family four-helix bundle protein [Zophobihabitans entericus]|uniref:ClbS/DfsB family four-helix bundle protein n=1 Tax=Zophobihabitans entericus TaxID=1635327 RepID=A0A6G9IAV2_9GAMM|nr:ClbS/DfsB family four-helix bundle protein [Zophobihabitans entericus]QIQ21356.1 ClbS/DfsB family four-helix bundle protein [Zophobihabitans entericus]